MEEEREVRTPGTQPGENIREAVTHAGELKLEEDKTTHALLLAAVKELRKINIILMEAFKSEIGSLEVSDADLEQRG